MPEKKHLDPVMMRCLLARAPGGTVLALALLTGLLVGCSSPLICPEQERLTAELQETRAKVRDLKMKLAELNRAHQMHTEKQDKEKHKLLTKLASCKSDAQRELLRAQMAAQRKARGRGR